MISQLLKNPEKLLVEKSISDLKALEKEIKPDELCLLFPFWKLGQLKVLIKRIKEEKSVKFQ